MFATALFNYTVIADAVNNFTDMLRVNAGWLFLLFSSIVAMSFVLALFQTFFESRRSGEALHVAEYKAPGGKSWEEWEDSMNSTIRRSRRANREADKIYRDTL